MLNVDVSCIHTFWKSEKLKEVRQIERIVEITRAGGCLLAPKPSSFPREFIETNFAVEADSTCS